MKKLMVKTVVLAVLLSSVSFASCKKDDDDELNGNEPEEIIEDVLETGLENGHQWIDLGLPSGIKWAICNVGAKTPDESGSAFAWAETVPDKGRYSEANCKYLVEDHHGGSLYKPTKYTHEYNEYVIVVDNKTTLDPEDDAATENWGGTWRMPTIKEFKELLYNCYWVWTDDYNNTGATGYMVFKARKNSDKGRKIHKGETSSSLYTESSSHIFFPTCGYFYGTLRDMWMSKYWLASLDQDHSHAAYIMSFDMDIVLWSSSVRENGCFVRAVCTPFDK